MGERTAELARLAELTRLAGGAYEGGHELPRPIQTRHVRGSAVPAGAGILAEASARLIELNDLLENRITELEGIHDRLFGHPNKVERPPVGVVVPTGAVDAIQHQINRFERLVNSLNETVTAIAKLA